MKLRLLLSFAIMTVCRSIGLQAQSDTIFVYSPDQRAGLHLAVREAGQWHHVGQLCGSDYGPWGAEKRMHTPSLCRAKDGSWRLVFQVNDHAPCFAAAYSRDLVNWRPQDYPRMQTGQCLAPVVSPVGDGFQVTFTANGHHYRTKASADFRRFTPCEPAEKPATTVQRETVDGKEIAGQLFVINSDEMGEIRNFFAKNDADNRLSAERMHDDAKNLAWLTAPVEATLSVDLNNEKPISDKLIGIFFEDISYAADGGLYAELVQNRDFEYSAKDRGEWTSTTAWHSARPIQIATEHPLSEQNPHYALLWNDTLWNEGWDGIAVEAGKKYDFSMFVLAGGQKQTFTIQLQSEDGVVLATSKLKTKGGDWQQYNAVLTVTKTDAKARLAIIPKKAVHVGVDMISLFPQETFMNRKNGLRKDLAEMIAALHPKFVRFPGGCMSHGQGLDNIYHWNETVGPLWERKPDMNIWHYHQTRGLGFFEYFQFCEDIGAEPLPVLAAGVPCQNSAANADGYAGQQGGIPMDEMPAYIDELCHLIDWANADSATNEWARKRAEAGHPEPFNLKYIGIGNEDIIGTTFEDRYVMICKALRERHPEIKVCGTVGPFHTPSADYLEGWDLCRRHPDLQYMTDEHYYESTGWFMHHRNYYDNYRRAPISAPEGATIDSKAIEASSGAVGGASTSVHVYLGEWAASTKVKRPNVETALAEALYLTDIERNGDVVEMTSYAPMLCKDGHSNWNPDMIYFSNTSVRTTPAYEVQRLFSVNSGDRYINGQLTIDNEQLRHRIGASLVRDSKTGKRWLKLVNALPVELRVNVEGLQLTATVKCEQFAGSDIEDQRAKTQVIETAEPTHLPPYSIRVIEI
mgnify:FL=1